VPTYAGTAAAINSSVVSGTARPTPETASLEYRPIQNRSAICWNTRTKFWTSSGAARTSIARTRSPSVISSVETSSIKAGVSPIRTLSFAIYRGE
jgi:hypothetical protein